MTFDDKVAALDIMDMMVKEMFEKHGDEIWNEVFEGFVSIEDLGFGDRENG